MEPFQRGPGKAKAIEILFFEEAEIQKTRGTETSFAASGPLSVLYFKDFNRFVLQLNDWKYPLLRRLIISSSPAKDEPSSRTYLLPAPNGFSFNLRINKAGSGQAFENFETILDHSTRFSVFGKEIPYRKMEDSPDEKHSRKILDATGPKEIISETMKKVIETVQNKAASLKSGTKNLTSTKKKVDLKEIKNKDFKKDAKSSFKKGFFETSGKLSNEFLQKRKNNSNLSEAKSFDDLKKTSDLQAPALYINKDDVESAILKNKQLFSYLGGQTEKPEEKRAGLMTNIREGARTIRNRVSNMISGDRNRDRNLNTPAQGEYANLPVPESGSHYQG